MRKAIIARDGDPASDESPAKSDDDNSAKLDGVVVKKKSDKSKGSRKSVAVEKSGKSKGLRKSVVVKKKLGKSKGGVGKSVVVKRKPLADGSGSETDDNVVKREPCVVSVGKSSTSKRKGVVGERAQLQHRRGYSLRLLTRAHAVVCRFEPRRHRSPSGGSSGVRCGSGGTYSRRADQDTIPRRGPARRNHAGPSISPSASPRRLVISVLLPMPSSRRGVVPASAVVP